VRVRAGGRGVLEVVGGSKPFLMLWRQQPKAKRAEAVLGFSVVVVYEAARRSTGRWSRTEDGRASVKMQLGLRMLRCESAKV
jgi:hypothetical protein